MHTDEWALPESSEERLIEEKDQLKRMGKGAGWAVPWQCNRVFKWQYQCRGVIRIQTHKKTGLDMDQSHVTVINLSTFPRQAVWFVGASQQNHIYQFPTSVRFACWTQGMLVVPLFPQDIEFRVSWFWRLRRIRIILRYLNEFPNRRFFQGDNLSFVDNFVPEVQCQHYYQVQVGCHESFGWPASNFVLEQLLTK